MDDVLKSYWDLENFLKGKLDPEGSRMIDEKISKSVAFANKVKAHRMVHEIIIDNGLLELKNQMTEWKKGKDPGFSLGKSGKIISTIIVVASLSLITYFTAFKSKQNDNLSQKITSLNEHVVTADKTQIENSKKIKSKSLTSLKEQKSIKSKNISILENREKYEIYNVNNLTFDTKISKLPLKIPLNSHQKIQLPVIPVSKPEDKIECNNYIPFFPTHKSSSCNGLYIGSIIFDETPLQYGNSPITYSIDGGKSFAQSSTFKNLANGEYKLAIKDKQGCIYYSEEIVELRESSDCNLSKEIAIVPSKGESWVPLVKDNEDVNLKIFDKSGRAILNKDIYQGFEWEGKSQNGSILPMGSYLYVLSFKNGDLLTGHITILN